MLSRFCYVPPHKKRQHVYLAKKSTNRNLVKRPIYRKKLQINAHQPTGENIIVASLRRGSFTVIRTTPWMF